MDLKKIYFWSFIVLLASYITLTFILPIDPKVLDKYNLTTTQLRLLNLTVVVPIAAIYLSALYGFLRFYDYTLKIRKTKEGQSFNSLSRGIMVLAFSLPIISIVGAVSSYIKFQYPDLLPVTVTVQNYINLLLSGTAIYFIVQGGQGLYSTLKNKGRIINPALALAGPIILASIFTWLITSHAPGSTPDRSFYIPEWLEVLTFAVPYTFIWCAGFGSIILLWKYKNGVKGSIYKRAFDNLSKGLAVIILMSILIQFITTLSERLSRLDLTPLLLLVYFLILLYAVGYGLVARGAKKLKEIEEA